MVMRSASRKGVIQEIAVLDTKSGTHRVLVSGVAAQYVESGHLLYVTATGMLMAAPFDPVALRITGDAVLVGDGVAVRGATRVSLSTSHDGTLAYVAGPARSPNRELVWVGRDGAARAVDSSWSGDMGGRPVLSPDGRAAAVGMRGASEVQLWVKQLDRGPATRVADVGSGPSWAPGGKSLLFSIAGSGALQTVPADGSALPSAIAGLGAAPQLSPDGKWLVYTWRGDIFGRRTDGDTTPVALVQDPATQATPALSPDGRWLAYSSDETGTIQVYVRPFPDTKVAKRQLSKTLGYYPRWSRSGRELFYIGADASGVGNLYAADVVPGAAFTTGTPKPLFSVAPFAPTNTNSFDVSPDGQQFLFTRSVGSTSADAQHDRIVIVQNFVAELKGKMRR